MKNPIQMVANEAKTVLHMNAKLLGYFLGRCNFLSYFIEYRKKKMLRKRDFQNERCRKNVFKNFQPTRKRGSVLGKSTLKSMNKVVLFVNMTKTVVLKKSGLFEN